MADSTSDPGFWWNWWVDLAVAVGTFLAVFVALFGDIMRSKWYPPFLTLQLPRPHGELTTVSYPKVNPAGGPIFTASEPGRFYHLEVSNARRVSPATNTQIMLTSLTLPGPGGLFQEEWHGEVPMRWEFQEAYSPARTVGHPLRCDICSVIKSGKLEIHTAFAPNNLAKFLVWHGPVNLILTFAAISDRADSEAFKVRISWDGKWEDGELEMAKHLSITPDNET